MYFFFTVLKHKKYNMFEDRLILENEYYGMLFYFEHW